MSSVSSSSDSLSDIEQSTFKTIATFVSDLSEIFASSYHELALYNRLLQKTTLSHEVGVRKNINAFKTFCVNNRKPIISRNYKDVVGKIIYSDKVFIDIKDIMIHADAETRKIIWLHLIKICAFVDPSTKAREILKENVSNESTFIDEIMTKVEQNIDLDATTNPLEAVTSIMNSGVFNDLMMGMNNKLQDGSIDLSKLMGTVETLCSSIKPADGDAGGGGGINGSEIFKMIQKIVPSIPGATGAPPSGLLKL
jgi:hypothetical protein